MKRARIHYVFTFLLAIFFIMTLYHRITVVFFWVVLALPVLAYLLMLLTYVFIKFDVTVEKKIYEKHEQSSTLIRISNEGFFPVSLINIKLVQIDENGKSAGDTVYAFSVVPFGSVDFKSEIVLNRRGLYEVGIREIELYDIFGLFRFKRVVNTIEEILVLPKRIMLYGEMSENIIAEEGDEKNKHKVGEDRTIVAHIRDYAEGDNINSIHWKLSLKKDELVVKVYDHPNDNNIMIIADMQAHEFEDADLWEDEGDCVVEAALSIAMKCVYENKRCTLYWYDTQQGTIVWYDIGTLSEFNAAFNHLAVSRVSFDGITAETILKNQEICDPHNKIIYVLNQGLDLKTADILSQLASSDDNEIKCACFDLKNKSETSEFANELSLANIDIVCPSDGADVETVLNEFIK